jgi:hypothetical protein
VDQAAIEKAAMTKKMNVIAGARPPLPGQHHLHENFLRAELTAFLNPADLAEIIWIIDMARCQASIEVLDAQMAGMRLRQVKSAHAARGDWDYNAHFGQQGEDEIDPAVRRERARLDDYASRGFTAPYKKTFLGDDAFGGLLGQSGRSELENIRLLQQIRHNEAKERDRLFNQLSRRRRQAMRDAILAAEDQRRAAVFDVILGGLQGDRGAAEQSEAGHSDANVGVAALLQLSGIERKQPTMARQMSDEEVIR